ncbi:SRPBCC domain-containing protein [Deinococcus sp. AJ005]|uniref:SRPBCC domain-containing protein n=1 Tax=Deinococcus sp. AJ005 TaxID=2652443 RepID=UPI00125CA95F|nr:SRPBCC domain-containing protein [Deinococcus sp. AJ005]QFP77090.1 SRPBCC domain-containing protein [Deinococcus sp. AJ005]
MTSALPAMTSRVENEKELILERTFKAPRALVFEAFTAADHLRHWWGPRGWELTHCTVDLRPGGKWHYCMKCMDRAQGDFYGMESWGLGVYDEIVAPERLVYTDYFSDAAGEINADLPTTQATLIFEEVAGGTCVVSRSVYGSEGALKTVMDMGMLQGIGETWDRLAEHLAGPQAG